MEKMTTYGRSNSLLLDSPARDRGSLVPVHESHSIGPDEQTEIQLRMRLVAAGWSAQERAARRRAGLARRAWLLNSIHDPSPK
jgi:hypothetical protein